ncbi:MAG: DNA polymerase III subunit gamma/tau [Muribaculaceae bacterium]|nr:DNA polymerase III subunit gamma/tau [Muribaculaceae bacterium]
MSEKYIVSARKYRPSTFRSVVGQQSLTHTLKSAIASGRLAHAYLFCGPRGVGKTTCARIFAKTINCEHPTPEGEACNECPSCKAFNEQRSYNINELDAASNNSVDNIRDLTEQVRIPPQTGRYRVFIIDEVHMLSQAAFNAFLKTLEEPPEYAIFILATTEKQKVIPTILSRCQIYDFARITVPDIVQQLQYVCEQESIEAEPAALNVIAQKADGAMRDALSIFDQVAASTEGHITYQSALENLNVLDYDYYFRLVDTFLAGDVMQALLIYKEIRDKGFDSQFFINGLAQHLRDLMVASTPQTRKLLEMNDEVAQQYGVQSAKLAPQFYYRALDLCNSCDLNYRNASSKQLLVELTLVKLCQLVVAPQPQQAVQQPISKIDPSPAKPVQQSAPAASEPPLTVTPPTSSRIIRPAEPVQAPHPAEQAPPPAPAPEVQAPTQQPRPAAPSPTASRPMPRAVGNTPRIMVNVSNDASAQQQAANSTNASLRTMPFSAEQLNAAWQGYIDQHPQERALCTTMSYALPQQGDNAEHYVMIVGSSTELKNVEEHKAALMEYLSDQLQNDRLTLDVKVSEVPIDTPKILSPREVVEQIKQHNPNFNQFLKDFDLGLA